MATGEEGGKDRRLGLSPGQAYYRPGIVADQCFCPQSQGTLECGSGQSKLEVIQPQQHQGQDKKGAL